MVVSPFNKQHHPLQQISIHSSPQIDPNRTISAGKVDIGAFRTFPENYTPPSAITSEYQSIPLSKIEDFGVHANQYYQLEVEIFKSSLDNDLLAMLWNKYWVNTLSQSPLISVRHSIFLQPTHRNLNIELILESSLRCFTTQRSAAEIVQSPGRRRQHQGSTTSTEGERRQGERGKEEGRKSISEECQRQVRLIQKSDSSRGSIQTVSFLF